MNAHEIISDILENEELEFKISKFSSESTAIRVAILLSVWDPNLELYPGSEEKGGWCDLMENHPFIEQIRSIENSPNFIDIKKSRRRITVVRQLNKDNLILRRINVMTGYSLSWYSFVNIGFDDACHYLHLDFFKPNS